MVLLADHTMRFSSTLFFTDKLSSQQIRHKLSETKKHNLRRDDFTMLHCYIHINSYTSIPPIFLKFQFHRQNKQNH